MAKEAASTVVEKDVELDYHRLDVLLEEFLGKKGIMVPVLQRIQEDFGYLPRPALEYTARQLRIPISKVYGIATFYAQFHLEPRGDFIIRVCRGTACHVRGGARISQRIKEILDVEVGETTPDLKFTLEEVACIGACGLAPVLMINENTHGKLTPDKLKKVIEQY